MRALIKQKVMELQNEMITSIVDSVKIPSVISEAKEGYPFGQNIDKALRHALELCKSLGFRTVYKDGYYGYAEIGEGEELIGILGHLDVVPEGELENWDVPPYEGVIKEGKLYGRGTQDDKGPTIAAIYAVKALMDLGVKFDKRVRFIFGTDEENLWRCINKYSENGEEVPNYGFTPDSKFPMINAEKGLLQALLVCDKGSEVSLKLGNAFNSVPDKAVYNDVKIEEVKVELNKLGFEYTTSEKGICVVGTGVHSQVADSKNAKNAIARLCMALNKVGINSNAIDFIAEVIGEDANANDIVKDCKDEVSGNLTFNIGKLDLSEEKQVISVDIRIPVTFDKETVVNNLTEKAKAYGLIYEEFDWLKSIYVPADNFLVKTLRKVYEGETGLDSTPLSSGGATYARALDNCVAFGSVFPNSPKTEHQPNEFIIINDLMHAAQIYGLAVYELLQG